MTRTNTSLVKPADTKRFTTGQHSSLTLHFTESKIPRLKKGDLIGYFSPSSPITANCPLRTERAVQFLNSNGYPTKAGKLSGLKDYYRSGSIAQRAEELNALIRDPNVRCIMSTIGGMNSNAIVPYIDYEALKRDPKWIIGYSDVTAILMAVYAQTGLTTLYGPALTASFGEMGDFPKMSLSYLEALMASTQDTFLHYTPEMPDFWTDEMIPWEVQDREKTHYDNQWISLKTGTASGRLLVANLNTLGGIWGSAYMPEIMSGDILLIEDSLKDAATVERSFAWMALNGVFDRVGGLILGKHELFNDLGTGRKPYEILLEVIGQPKCPTLVDYDCCHTHPMITLPIGTQATLKVL